MDFDGQITPREEEELKEWFWQQHKDEIRAALESQVVVEDADAREVPKTVSSAIPGVFNDTMERTVPPRQEILDLMESLQRLSLDETPAGQVFEYALDRLFELTSSDSGSIIRCTQASRTESLATRLSSSKLSREWNTQEEFERVYHAHLSCRTQQYSPAEAVQGALLEPRHAAILGVVYSFPLFGRENKLVGVLGLANLKKAYMELFQPLVVTLGRQLQSMLDEERLRLLEERQREDLLQRQALEQENEKLRVANRELKLSSESALQHFACMSHELRTPMNAVIAVSSLLQESQLTPLQDEFIRMIVASGDLLLTVVNDVLDYSKLESVNVDIDIQQCNLQETLNSIVHALEIKANLHNAASIRTQYDVRLPEHISTDSRRVQQILYNLLGNAIKFCPAGSEVELSVMIVDRDLTSKPPPSSAGDMPQSGHDHGLESLVGIDDSLNEAVAPMSASLHDKEIVSGHLDSVLNEGASISVGVLQQDCSQAQCSASMIRLSVKDYGVGIEKKNFGRIFQPYLQADAETERRYGGTGLGLAITAKLVRAMGGMISVDSQKGQWSEFTVDLPFDGVPFDVASLSHELKNTFICVVHKFGDKSLRFLLQILRDCSISHATFSCMKDIELALASQGATARRQSYVCLTDEDLFDEESFELLSEITNRCALMTFGPKFSVTDSVDHFRSLTQTLPSVVLAAMLGSITNISKDTSQQSALKRMSSARNILPYQDLSILIAEDNLVNQKILFRMLSRLGVGHIDIVGDGSEAVEQESKWSYDVILMDMYMPHMNGMEACRIIGQREDSRPKPAIVFVTANVSDSFEAECHAAGGSGYLPKPYNLRELEQCFKKLFKERLCGIEASSLSGEDKAHAPSLLYRPKGSSVAA